MKNLTTVLILLFIITHSFGQQIAYESNYDVAVQKAAKTGKLVFFIDTTASTASLCIGATDWQNITRGH